MVEVKCFHCGIDVDINLVHTDELEDYYPVEACEECCTICQRIAKRKSK